MLDLWLDDNSPQSIEAADEVADRVGEKVVAIGDPSFKKLAFQGLGQNMKPDAADEFFLAQESFLERCKARG